MTADAWRLVALVATGASALMTVLWLVQRARSDATLVDAGWTAGLGAAAIVYASFVPGAAPSRRVLVAAMAAIWAARLFSHLVRDRMGSGVEDGRYAKLRRTWGAGAQPRFFVLFQVQALLVAALSLPYVAALQAPAGAFGAAEIVAIALWSMSLVGESIADRQLAAFRAVAANRGRTCRTGLWRWSRHPNYFFEWLHWWSWVPLAWSGDAWGFALAGPLAMLLLLVFVTGVPPSEARALESRGDDYRRYQRETSMFIPWFPRKAA